jgi:hypothetical protein
MSALPSFDRSAIEAHVALIHDLAEGLDGVLILAAFETGGHAQVQRFRIRDVDGMAETIMGFENHPNLNLYTPYLQAFDFDLGLIGFSADEIAGLTFERSGLTDPDEAPDAPAIPVSAPGDVWLLGRHRLVCGDCTDPLVVDMALNGVKPHLSKRRARLSEPRTS